MTISIKENNINKINSLFENKPNEFYKVNIIDGLKTLEKIKFPETFTGDINIHSVTLTSLIGLPKYLKGNINLNFCSNLNSLEGLPEYIEGIFNAVLSQIHSFKNSTLKKVKGSIRIYDCGLTDVSNHPQIEGGYFSIQTNNIKTLNGLNTDILNIKILDVSYNPLEELTDLSKMKNLNELRLDHCKLTNLNTCPKKLKILSAKSNNLKSLIGAPEFVEETFDVSFNKLKSLKYIPEVKKEIDISNNELSKLDYQINPTIKKVVIFKANNNNLKDLQNSPIFQIGDFSHNKITSLKGSPKKVKELNLTLNELKDLTYAPNAKKLLLNSNKLTSLKGMPTSVEHLDISRNHNLKSINHFPKQIKTFICTYSNNLTEIDLSDLNYIKDMTIDEINLEFNKIKKIYAPFKKVNYFNIEGNNINSLKGFPKTIEILNTSNNPIIDFDTIPNITKSWYNINKNPEYNNQIFEIFSKNNKTIKQFLLLPNIKELNFEFNVLTDELLNYFIKMNSLFITLPPKEREELLITEINQKTIKEIKERIEGFYYELPF